MWDEIKIPIRYRSDRSQARALLESVVMETVGDYSVHAKVAWENMVGKYRIEDARIESMIILQASDNWMEYTVRSVVVL